MSARQSVSTRCCLASGRVSSPSQPRRALVLPAGVLLLGIALIHFASGGRDLADYEPFGYLFFGAAALELLLALLLLCRPTRFTATAAAVVSAAVVGVWLLSRVAGMPFGPTTWQPMAVNASDLLTTIMQLGLLGLLAAAQVWRKPSGRGRGSRLIASATSGVAALAVLLVGVPAVAMETGDVRWPATPLPAAASPAASITYCTPNGVALAMDVSEPSAGTPRPAPAVLYVHGGGWAMGDRKTDLTQPAPSPITLLPAELASRGYVLASIDYRLSPVYAWPAQIEDAKCAVRFLRAHAAELGIDPNRIGAFGRSAGGQLVSLLGTAGPDPGWDIGEYADQSSQVQAVVDLFGPTDLTHFDEQAVWWARCFAQLTMGSSTSTRSQASPLTWVAPNDPPFMILQGKDDTAVPPSQSEELADRLTTAGVPLQLVLVDHAGHGLANPGEEPAAATLADRLLAFFDATLQ